VFVSRAAVEAGRVEFRESKSKTHKGSLEIVGPPDLVVEFVSDTSVRKDPKVLPRSYFAAGIREFWLFDCRGQHVRFDLLSRGRGGYHAAQPDGHGFRRSDVLDASFRLTRKALRPPIQEYTLDIR
jgi:Uma2 family endonuclease